MNRTNTPLLSASELHKSFGQAHALRGVSFTVAPGELVAVMGPSGSGKSTLLHCLSGVLPPDSGSVVFDGSEFGRLSDAARSRLRLRRFGFVFQDGQLIPELQARENVILPMQLTGVSRRDALRAADSMLERLGVAELAKRLPGDMSGGQAQRVALARALAPSPAVVFADEPTGALDQATGQEVMQVLTATAEMSGTALVIVTHDRNVAGWCHRLVEIRDGLIHSDQRIGGGVTA